MADSVLAARASTRAHCAPKGEREHLLMLADGKKDLIRLGRGDPDLDTPKVITEAAVAALRNGYTHYTHWAGMQELRTLIANKLREDNGLEYNPHSEIVVSTGGQEAMNAVVLGLLDPGDEVLIADPYYTSYHSVVSLAQGSLKFVPTSEDDDFAIQPEALEAGITPKTKLLVLVSPNNPTGAVIPRSTLEDIVQIVRERDLLVLSDEIYEQLVYDGFEHVSIASLPGMRERTVVLNGFSKTYSMTGWRIGYFAAPADFVERVHMIKYTMTISVNHAAQAGAIAALSPEGRATVGETRAVYEERRAFMMGALNDMGLTYGYPGGAFYIFANVASTGMTGFEFCKTMLLDAGVQMFPGTVYGSLEGYVRISLLQPLDRLKLAAKRMAGVIESGRAGSRG